MEKILLIEDDTSYLENIRILLEEESFNVISAMNGLDGIDLAKSEVPDLIICDIMLPDIDGYTIIKELRKRDVTKFIPVIFLTAKALMTDLRKGMNLGADDYITKPFRADDLLAAINVRLEKARLFNKAIERKSPLPGTKTKLGLDDYLFLPGKSNYEVLPVTSVLYFQSDGVYSNVITTEGKKILIRKLLKEWEDTLPGSSFLRIHKSYIVNKKYIKKIEKWFNGTMKLYLEHSADPLIVSRRYAARLKKNI